MKHRLVSRGIDFIDHAASLELQTRAFGGSAAAPVIGGAIEIASGISDYTRVRKLAIRPSSEGVQDRVRPIALNLEDHGTATDRFICLGCASATGRSANDRRAVKHSLGTAH